MTAVKSSSTHTTAGGAQNAPKRGRPSKADKAARRGKSMGRHPLMAAVNRYLERRELQVAPSTYAMDRRRLYHIARAIEEMREMGKIGTSNPTNISEAEIRAFVDWMIDPSFHNGKSLDTDTQVRYLAKLEEVLKHNGNDVVERMRKGGYNLPTRASPKPIKVIGDDDLKTLLEAASSMPGAFGEPTTWRSAKARFIVSFFISTGLRHSELRLAHIEDLDVKKWRFFVRHPKGGGKWANGRTVAILPPYRNEVLNFLEERVKLLEYHGVDKSTYLIPNLRGGADRPYSGNHFRELKTELQMKTGVQFKIKDFRSTFASINVELDPALMNDVSVMLGHSNIATTQRYYAQISADSAGSRLEKAWEKVKPIEETPMSKLLESHGITSLEELEKHLSKEVEKPRNREIDFQNPMSGYF